MDEFDIEKDKHDHRGAYLGSDLGISSEGKIPGYFMKGEYVLYLSPAKLHAEKLEIDDDDLGTVSTISDRYVFVQFRTSEEVKACKPEDLFKLYHRPDLVGRLMLIRKGSRIPVDDLYLEVMKHVDKSFWSLEGGTKLSLQAEIRNRGFALSNE